MRPGLLRAPSSSHLPPKLLSRPLTHRRFITTLPSSSRHSPTISTATLVFSSSKSSEPVLLQSKLQDDAVLVEGPQPSESLSVSVGSPRSVVPAPKFSLSDQAFFLLSFIASTATLAFMGLVIAAVPTLNAMGRAAISLSKLADTAREELPSTMAAIRLSGMEVSDLTLELSDLSQEIADGVNKSSQAVQAAEAGIRHIGSIAHHQTMSIIQERASLPIISLQPVVAGAAKKTSQAVGQATKTFINIISRGEHRSESDDVDAEDRIDV